MAEKLTPEKIEEIGKHYENIQSGKTPILKSEKETKINAHADVSNLMKKKEDKTILPLIPPTDPRLLMQVATFKEDMLKDFKLKDRKELGTIMYDTMKKYGGIGLSANQVGLPFNMFVMGGHPQLNNGLKMTCFNPTIIQASVDTIMMKEGCLTYPYLFLNISRPRKITAKYEDEEGNLKEASLDGMISRIYQHEYDHMLGRNFTELVSKFKLDMARKKAGKLIKRATRYAKNQKT